MSEPRLSLAQRDAMMSAWLAGTRVVDLASRFGVDKSYPRVLAKRRGLTRPAQKPGPKPERRSL